MAAMPAVFEWDKVKGIDPATLKEGAQETDLFDMFASVTNGPYFTPTAPIPA